MLIDTHCHIHDTEFTFDHDSLLTRARQARVEKMICVGTSETSSRDALQFAAQQSGVYASIGVHPHDTKDGHGVIEQLARGATSDQKLVAIGEIGLDYFYTHSSRDVQLRALEAQLQVAVDCRLPVIFHVRDAFDDFWPLFDTFSSLRGVLHSFTDTQSNLEKGLSRGLSVGVNGISLFTRDDAQRELFDTIPLDRLLFETDAPFLTPPPHRGKVNEPAYVELVAHYHAQRRSISFDEIAAATTANATALFAL